MTNFLLGFMTGVGLMLWLWVWFGKHVGEIVIHGRDD